MPCGSADYTANTMFDNMVKQVSLNVKFFQWALISVGAAEQLVL